MQDFFSARERELFGRQAVGGDKLADLHEYSVAVISSDKELIRLCRETFADLPGRNWEFVSRSHPTVPRDCRICLWDCGPGLKPPPRNRRRKDLYLVGPDQVEELCAKYPEIKGSLILKPTTRPVLQAFLSAEVGPLGAAGDAEIGALKADRDEILQSLLHANLRLQEYDLQRTRFLSRVVHDFCTPLTALDGYCSLLASEKIGPVNPQQKDALQRMRRTAGRVFQMASSMLDLSVERSSPRPVRLQKGCIAECIEQVVCEFRPLMEEKFIALTAEVVEPSGSLRFDPQQIEQVLVNLLDNARKATPRYGSVKIVAQPCFWERRATRSRLEEADRRAANSATPNAFRVDVTDSGPGVPAEYSDYIFDEYTTVPDSVATYGSGLGLAVCKMILERHRGRIWVNSDAQGATFSFVVPYPEARQVAPDVQVRIGA